VECAGAEDDLGRAVGPDVFFAHLEWVLTNKTGDSTGKRPVRSELQGIEMIAFKPRSGGSH
jgi:hypothetical protein